MIILQKIINSIRLYFKELLIIFIFVFLIIIVTITVNNYQIKKTNEIAPEITRKGYKANYSLDLKYLDCMAEQHKCLYKNLLDKIDHLKILENCNEENYCASSTSKF